MYLTGIKLKRRGGAWFQHQSYFPLIPCTWLVKSWRGEEGHGFNIKLFQTHSMYLTGVQLKRGRDQSKRPMNTGLLDICTWTRSEAVGFVITDIPPLSRTSGLRRTVRCVKSPPYVRITFSYSNLHDMTNSTIEICQVGLRPPGVSGNTTPVCKTVCTGVGETVAPRCLLIRYWVNLGFLVGERLQTTHTLLLLYLFNSPYS